MERIREAEKSAKERIPDFELSLREKYLALREMADQ